MSKKENEPSKGQYVEFEDPTGRFAARLVSRDIVREIERRTWREAREIIAKAAAEIDQKLRER